MSFVRVLAWCLCLGRSLAASAEPPADSLVLDLVKAVGAGGPVAILGGAEGVIAASPDGRRVRVLVAKPAAWVLQDNRADVIWLGLVDDPAVYVLDLEAPPGTAPQMVTANAPDGLAVTVVHAAGEELARVETEYYGNLRLLVSAKPGLKYAAGAYDDVFVDEAKENRAAARKATFTPKGRALVVALAKRAAGRHVALPFAEPAAATLHLPSTVCPDAELCGEGAPVPGTPFLFVPVARICGDLCHVVAWLYDPRAQRFFDPRSTPPKTLKLPEAGDDAAVIEEDGCAWISPDGAHFIMEGQVIHFAGGTGAKVTDGSGGGWLLGQWTF